MRSLALVSATAFAALAAEAAAPAAAVWGQPAALGGCALSAPAVAFPSSAPDRQTGAGAVAWLSTAGCASGGAAVLELAPVERGAAAGAPLAFSLGTGAADRAAAPPAVVGAGFGEVAALAPGPDGQRQVLAGRAGGRMRRVAVLPGDGPAALARAYLGDAAAAVAAGGRIQLAVLRYFRHNAGPVLTFATGRAPVTALALALDFRAETLLAWQQGGSIYARLVSNSGRLGPIQRVGRSAPRPTLQATLSDNGHAILAWSAGAGGGRRAGRTAVSIAFTDAHTRFGRPRTLASFADPSGLARRPGSLGLVRLAGENVLLAWTVREGGRYRVLAAPAVFAGARPAQALSSAGRDATLETLVPGPANEALAIWREGGAVSACSLLVGEGDVVLPCAAQQVPGVRLAAPLAAGIEPAGDRPVISWLDRAATPAGIRYLAGSPLRAYSARGYSPPASVAQTRSGIHWLRIAAAILVAGAACAAIALLLRRRRARR